MFFALRVPRAGELAAGLGFLCSERHDELALLALFRLSRFLLLGLAFLLHALGLSGWHAEVLKNFCLYSGWPQLAMAIRQGEGALVSELFVQLKRSSDL